MAEEFVSVNVVIEYRLSALLARIYSSSRVWCKPVVTTFFYITSYNSFAPSPRYIDIEATGKERSSGDFRLQSQREYVLQIYEIIA